MSIPPGTEARQQADARVRAYLRCLGIPDEQATAIASESGDDPASAIQAAFRLKEQWGGHPATNAESPLLAWFLRRSIDRAGAAGLDRLPDPHADPALRQCPRATPVEQPAPMPIQPLGDLPRLLQLAFWRRQFHAVASLFGGRKHRRLQRG